MGIQPEGERKNDTGESVFPETDPFSLFSGLLIYLLLHIETNGNFKVTRVSSPDLYPNQVLRINVYKKVFRGFTSSSGYEPF